MFSLLVLIARGLDLQLCRRLASSLFCSVLRVQSLEVGVFNGEGPPVPIPNTAVKLTCADNTCLATGREDRSTPTQRNLRSKSFGGFLISLARSGLADRAAAAAFSYVKMLFPGNDVFPGNYF